MHDWDLGESNSPNHVDALVWALSELSKSRYGPQELKMSALIKARASVSDSVAERKIQDGT
jgi:hypothetical protein